MKIMTEKHDEKIQSFMLKTSRGEIIFAVVVILIAVLVALFFLCKTVLLKSREVSVEDARAVLSVGMVIEPPESYEVFTRGNIIIKNNGEKKIAGYVTLTVSNSGYPGVQDRNYKWKIALAPGESYQETAFLITENATVTISSVEDLYYE